MALDLRKVELVPTNNTSPAGGAGTATSIDGSSTDQWITRLPSPETGTVDVDFNEQFQAAAATNTSASNDVENGKFWVNNLYAEPVAPGLLYWKSDSAADDNTLKVRTWMREGSSLVVEDIILNGTAAVNGARTVVRAFRSVVLNVSDDTIAANTGKLTGYIGGTSSGDEVVTIHPGVSWATGELEFGASATLDDTVEVANRTTDPVVTYSRPRNEATALDLGTLTAESYRKIWGRHRVQPGMPLVTEVVVDWDLQGDEI